ncbi:MAG: hypothetical protein JSR78_10555 [Proteobacteria bacterium]|nr:hypothetical protein [Pseudomonadota bacterium]
MGETEDDYDYLRSLTVEALRVLGTSNDAYAREEYLFSVLKLTQQRGEIIANDRMIQRNKAALEASEVPHD